MMDDNFGGIEIPDDFVFYPKEDPIIAGPSPPCRKCGKSHGTGLLDTRTNVHTPIDLCYDCLWADWQPKVLTEQIVLTDD